MFSLPLSVLVISFVACCLGDPICGPNESYDCRSPCQATCQNRQFAHCSPKCVPGCYCDSDYIKDEEADKCVLVEDCTRY